MQGAEPIAAGGDADIRDLPGGGPELVDQHPGVAERGGRECLAAIGDAEALHRELLDGELQRPALVGAG